LPNTTLDFFCALSEMGMAGEEVVPGIENSNHGLPFVFLVIDAELLVPGTVPEGTEIVRSEKSM
jgi:hypothetical protein